MFSLRVIDTDAFCEMPSSAQNLYFQIGMRADDEGFFAGVKGLMAKIHSGTDDLNILLARGFLLDRGDGVYVVKHWKMNNYLQKDRIQPTEYEEKKIGLFEKADGSYTIHKEKSKCIQNVYIGKCSVVENREEKNNTIDGYGKEIASAEKNNDLTDDDLKEAAKTAKEIWGDSH
jgi:hypothetical protein